jgi:hypothetical protein
MERGARIAEASGQHKRKPNSRLPAPRLPMTSSSCERRPLCGNTSGTRVSRMPSLTNASVPVIMAVAARRCRAARSRRGFAFVGKRLPSGSSFAPPL